MSIRLLGIVFVCAGYISALCLVLMGIYFTGIDQSSFWLSSSAWPLGVLVLLVSAICTILGSKLMLLPGVPSRS